MAAGSDQRKLELKDVPILRRLGQGYSGYLYETEWGGKKYARKDFPLGSVELNNLFKTEVQPLFDLDHPNIVKCFGYTLGKSSCSLVQEYVEENLQNTIQSRIEEQRKKSSRSTSTSTRVLDADEIKRLVSSRGKKKETATTDEDSSRCPRSTPFEGHDTISIIAQIASAMNYLHENRVAHGDLKPRNVLLSWGSGERRVKVADFGLSEIKKRITLVSERSRHVETLTWKAPECLEEDEEILGPTIGGSDEDRDRPETDSAGEGGDYMRSRLAMADVYSFGLTCSYILGGGKLRTPDVSLTKLQGRRMRGCRPKLPSACPKDLKFMIDSCLEFDPLSRPTFTMICTMAALQPYVTYPTKVTEETSLQIMDIVGMEAAEMFERSHIYGDGSQRPDKSKRFLGVRKSFFGVEDRPWCAEVKPRGEKEKIWLGTFNTPEAAARAVDAGRYYYGYPDNLNFSDSPQHLRPIPMSLSNDAKRRFVKYEARRMVELPSTWDPDNHNPRASSDDEAEQVLENMDPESEVDDESPDLAS